MLREFLQRDPFEETAPGGKQCVGAGEAENKVRLLLEKPNVELYSERLADRDDWSRLFGLIINHTCISILQ